MTPVKQTNTSKERGDCQRAAVASLFDFEIEQVPNFRLFDDDIWWDVFCGFIWGIGYEVVECVTDGRKPEGTIGSCLLAAMVSDYGGGYSHQVLINTEGVVVHDPLPGAPNVGRNIIDEGVIADWNLIRRREI